MPLLTPEDQHQLRADFAQMSRQVHLVFFTQTLDCETCLQTRQILDELPSLSDRIIVDEVNFILEPERAAQYGIDRVPAIALASTPDDAAAPAGGLADSVSGIPAGYEFVSLVQAILLAGGRGPNLTEASRQRLAAVDRPITLQVFTTPTCPHCPRAVSARPRDGGGESASDRVCRRGHRIPGSRAPLSGHRRAEDGRRRAGRDSRRRSGGRLHRAGARRLHESQADDATRRFAVVVVVAALLPVLSSRATEPVAYRFTFPEPEHHWMQVEATFPDLAAAPLELRMSRASPGRYSLHDFAKNVYDVHAFGADGRELPTSRPDPYGWNVGDHGGSVTVTLQDLRRRRRRDVSRHRHRRMRTSTCRRRSCGRAGSTIARSTLTFAPPTGTGWQVATQLHPGATAVRVHRAEPAVSDGQPGRVRSGRRSDSSRSTAATFRVRRASHRAATASSTATSKTSRRSSGRKAPSSASIPDYEPGHYTFLADYLPYATGDGMEHRNSTVMTVAASIATDRRGLLDTVAHEFFHGWNVERIRPRSLEPFDFERANMSGELWLAEGFTQYYGPLTLQRAGLADLRRPSRDFTEFVETAVASHPGARSGRRKR